SQPRSALAAPPDRSPAGLLEGRIARRPAAVRSGRKRERARSAYASFFSAGRGISCWSVPRDSLLHCTGRETGDPAGPLVLFFLLLLLLFFLRQIDPQEPEE